MKREVWTKTGNFEAGHYQVMDLTLHMSIRGVSGGDIIKRLFVRVGGTREILSEWKEDSTLQVDKWHNFSISVQPKDTVVRKQLG